MDIISLYLASKEHSWAPLTKEKEAHKLLTLAPLLSSTAEDAWRSLSHLSPYSRTQYWCRLVDLCDFAIEKGIFKAGQLNIYRAFRKANRLAFRHVYDRDIPEVSFKEAMQRIALIPNEAVRKHAEAILKSGLRWCESLQPIRSQKGKVVGKGGKRRTVYLKDTSPLTDIPYTTFYRMLKKYTGLKPHDLRKIMATHLAHERFPHMDIMEVMGWNSFETARSYIRASEKKTLEALLEEALK